MSSGNSGNIVVDNRHFNDIYVDSQYRQSGTVSDFRISLSNTIFAKRIKIDKVEFPHTIYNVNEYNNSVVISLTDPPTASHILTITPGNYSSSRLKSELIDLLLGVGITTTISESDGKFTFNHDTPISFFSSHQSFTSGEILGFNKQNRSSTFGLTQTSDICYSLLYPRYLLLSINVFSGGTYNNLNVGNIAQKIPIDHPFFSQINYINQNMDDWTEIKAPISTLDIRILDPQLRTVEMNGSNISIDIVADNN
jgi:hypothetical protein